MNAFHYQNRELCVEDIPLARIAEQYGTPCYVYAESALTQAYSAYSNAFAVSGKGFEHGVPLRAQNGNPLIAVRGFHAPGYVAVAVLGVVNLLECSKGFPLLALLFIKQANHVKDFLLGVIHFY